MRVTIGPSGGRVTSNDRVVTLDVPAGALASDVPISITRSSAAPAGAIGSAYDLGPEGTKFAVPASLTIRFKGSDLGGMPPGQLEIGTVVAGAWEPAPGSIIDEAASTVSVPTSHLSRWAIIPAATSPCTCHTSDWKACCAQYHGRFATIGQECVCSGYDGDSDGFYGCYTARIGGDRVTNFCSACLGTCCTKSGGMVTSSCDCDLSAPGVAAAVLMCSRKCFSSPDKATVCATCSGAGTLLLCGSPGGGQGGGKSAPQPTCGAASCPHGCCDDQGTCQVGIFDRSCGTGGSKCVACKDPDTCGGGGTEQVCATADRCRTYGDCAPGVCCDPESVPCADCGCDSTSCPDGCCDDQGICQPGTFDSACGTGGKTCSTCTAPDTCGGGETAQVCGDVRDAGIDSGVKKLCKRDADCVAGGCCDTASGTCHPATFCDGGTSTKGPEAGRPTDASRGDGSSGFDAADGATDPWVGTWSCTQTDYWNYTEPPGAKPAQTTESSSQTTFRNADGSYTVTLGCPVLFTRAGSGNTATLESGQSCPVSFTTVNITEFYSSATATVVGNTANMTVSYTFSGTEVVDGAVVNLAGSATTTATCTRQ